MEKRDDGLERLMEKLGDFGRYQCLQFVMHLVATVIAGINMFSLVTIAAAPAHRCVIPGVDTPDHPAPWNSSLVLDAIPVDKHGKLDSCTMFGENKTLIECDSWVYADYYYTSSRGIEWNFVCHRRWMFAVAEFAVNFGAMVGAGILGGLCDRFGRKTIFHTASILQLVLGTGVAFTSEYYTFLVIRFFYGMFGMSAYKAGFVLTIELVGPSWRNFCGSIFEVGYAVGVMLIALWGFVLDDRFYLQIVYALHAILLLPHLFLMDESIRWLWAQGRVEEAVSKVQKALLMNKSSKKIDTPLLKRKDIIKDDTDQAKAWDLFKTPNMLKRTLIICGCWFANSFVYFGLTLNTGNLNGNPYLILFLMGFVEVPGFAIAMYFVRKVGNRTLISGMMYLGGLCCLSVVAIPTDSVAVIVVVILGKLIISGTHAIAIKYSAEIFPTVARSSGVGLATMFSCFSAAVSPLILLLDSLNPHIPTTVFGIATIISGTTVLLLPETFGRTLPQTLEDGEKFEAGNTCFTQCRGRRDSDISLEETENTEQLKPIRE